MATSTRSVPKPSRPYHHGNLRRALLDEALATIRKEGVETLTLREIGTRVGVSRTALYRHFADKRALLTAVATEGFSALRRQLIAAWEEGGRDRAAFQAMGRAYIAFALDNPSHYRVMFGSFVDLDDRHPEFAVEAEGAFRALVNALAELQQQQLVRADNTALMARFVWSVVHGVSMLGMDDHLRKSCAIEDLTQYAIDRIGTGIYPAQPTNGRRVRSK